MGGANGIGIIDIVENRLVGEGPGRVRDWRRQLSCTSAHEQLEMLTVDKRSHLHVKQKLPCGLSRPSFTTASGTPLQEALTAFANESNKYVTGPVKLEALQGNIILPAPPLPYSLYSENLASFGESDYDQNQAAGFINLWGPHPPGVGEQGKL